MQLSYRADDPDIPGGTPWVYGTWTSVVGSGTEFIGVYPCWNGTSCIDVDLSDTNILATMHYPANEPGDFTRWDFNGIRILDVNGTIPAFISVAINPATNMIGFDASRITFDSDNIWVNWQGLYGRSDTVVSLDVTGAPVDDGGSAVPEPASLLLFGSGMVGLGVRAWRKRRG